MKNNWVVHRTGRILGSARGGHSLTDPEETEHWWVSGTNEEDPEEPEYTCSREY